MAKEVTQAPDASETDAGKAAAPTRKDRKSLYLTGGLVALTALAWGLSVMAVPGKEKEVRHLLAGPFVASISPQTGFQVNLAGKSGKNYLAMDLKAEVDAFQEAYATARAGDPLFRAKLTDAVLRVASRKTKTDLGDDVGKDLFREELKLAVDPVLFPVHVGNEADPSARHAKSGLRAGSSNHRATMRGLFYDHELSVDAAKKTIRLDGGEPVGFSGDETDLKVEGQNRQHVYVDVSGLEEDFHGEVHVGILGRTRNVYFGSFLIQ